MKILDIDKNDGIYVERIKHYDTHIFADPRLDKLFEQEIKYEDLESLIESINFVNHVKTEDVDLDVALVDDVTLRVYDRKSKQTVSEYEIIYDLNNSVMSYLWERIKLRG